jgi:hypothetical protein
MISVFRYYNNDNDDIINEGTIAKILAGISGITLGVFNIGVFASQTVQRKRYEALIKALQTNKTPDSNISSGGNIAKIGAKTLFSVIPWVSSIILVREQFILDNLKKDIGLVLTKPEIQKIINLRQKKDILDKKDLKILAELEDKFWSNLNEHQKDYLVKKYKRFLNHSK